MRELGLTLMGCVALCACGARHNPATTPEASVAPTEIEELHFKASSRRVGFDVCAYDAQSLFEGALGQMKEGRCDPAIRGFDRVAAEFPTSAYLSASLYNAGLCLQRQQRWAEAIERYERLIVERPRSPHIRHARFQLAFLYLETRRWREALAVAESLLRVGGLEPDERAEAMSRRASALLGSGDLAAAAWAARATLRFYRTRKHGNHVRDPYFVASAGFTLAETIRLQSEAITIPPGTAEEQHAVLERRAQLLLRAQRSYFDTIRLTDPYWASAAGYRIGAMYESFWEAIMAAPVPPPKREMSQAELAVYRAEYRRRLAELVRPLTRHAIRYWELTLGMVERTGVRSEWAEKTRVDLEKAKSRLLADASRAEILRVHPIRARAPDSLDFPGVGP